MKENIRAKLSVFAVVLKNSMPCSQHLMQQTT